MSLVISSPVTPTTAARHSARTSTAVVHADVDSIVEHLYQTHAHVLHGFARRRVGRQEAEDVVQDAYLHLLQQGMIATLDHPRAYLFRIAANLAVDSIRKARTRLRYAEDPIEFPGSMEADATPEASLERALEIRRLQACVSELPARCREIFRLGLIEGLTHAEIAERLGVSVRTVDRHFVKAVAHVRRRISHGFRPPEDPAVESEAQSATACRSSVNRLFGSAF